MRLPCFADFKGPSPPLTMTARQKIWRFLRHYLYGLFVKSFTGAVSAMDATIGLAVGSAVTASVEVPTWKTAVAVFATTFGRSALRYFVENPIPPALPDSTPPFPKPIP